MNWLKQFWKNLATPLEKESRTTKSFDPMPSEEAWCNFTPRAQQVIRLARREADQLHHNFVGTEHLLLGLMALGQGVAVNVLRKLGLQPEAVRAEIIKHVGAEPDQKPIGHLLLTPRVKKVFALADKERRMLKHTYVGTEHLLLGLIREGDGVAGRVMINLRVDLIQVRQEILNELDPHIAYDYSQTRPAHPESTSLSTLTSDATKTETEASDPKQRYDVYCVETGDRQVVYRNVRFKGIKRIFPEQQQSDLEDFYELEQADGQIIFVAKFSILKFTDTAANPGPGIPPKD